VAGDAAAWTELQGSLQPTVAAIARAHAGLRERGLAGLPDEIAELTAATFERLSKHDFQNLRAWQAKRQAAAGASAFDGWLYGAVDYAVREHLRRRYGRAPSEASESQGVRPSKRDLQSHAGRLDDPDAPDRAFLQTLSMTARLTAREIFAFAGAHFSPQELEALRLYYQEDQSFEDIARRLGLESAQAADRLIRRLNARLRYQFLESKAGDDDSP
jgi:RNA polymerase sigma factor (sigma-70 family)